MRQNAYRSIHLMSLILGLSMALALLPGCGGGGGGDSCNSIENQKDGNEDACALEEVAEEEIAFELEMIIEEREVDATEDRSIAELTREIGVCENIGCDEDPP